MKTLDLKGAVTADSVYVDNELVARNVTFTLPSITPLTNEFKAMGAMVLPIPGMFEDMEFSITQIGVDLGLRSMIKMRSMNFEFRWMQTVVNADGSQAVDGCKAFIRGIPKGIPGISVDPSAPSENEVAGTATRYQLNVNGTDYWLIDRLNYVCIIAGENMLKNVENML